MNFWQFLERNDEFAIICLFVLGFTVAILAGIFSECQSPSTREKRQQFIEQCIHTERSADECIKLSREM